MEQQELEEKVTMMEELIQGFVTRMTAIETEMPEFLKSFLQQYKETLDQISNRIETSNKRYVVVGSKESRVFGSLDYRIFGINAVEEMALMNTEPVSKVDQIILRFKESLPVL